MSSWTGTVPNVLGGGGWIDLGPHPTYATDMNNGTLYISKVATNFTIPFSMTLGATGSYLGGATNITIPAGCNVKLATPVNWANVTVNGILNFASGGKVNATNVALTSSGSATHEELTQTNGNPKINIEASGTVDIQNGATISANSKGYPAIGTSGYGFGWSVAASCIGCPYTIEGGNHFTRGGGPFPQSSTHFNGSNILWGNRFEPDTYGGAGSQSLTPGGGIVRIIADTINLDGSILSSAAGAPGSSRGGSAGGSIFLQATTINAGSSNNLQARGASTGILSTGWMGYSVGGGAGGLIGIKYHTLNGALNTDVTSGQNWRGDTGVFEKLAEDGLVTLTPF